MLKDFATPLASMIVAIVAAWGAFSSQRQVTKSNEFTSRLDYEKDAFNRARALDEGTIQRQNNEIEDLKGENADLREEIKGLRKRVQNLEKYAHLTEGSEDD